MKNIVTFACMLLASSILVASETTMTPIDVIVSSDGTQAVSQMLVTYPDGVSEVMTVYVDNTTMSTAGTSRIPGVSNITFDPIYGPCEPDPNTGECGLTPMSKIIGEESMKLSGVGENLQPQWVIPVIIGTCVAGHVGGMISNYLTCRNQGGISSSTVAYCGIVGGETSVECNNPPHEPPEPPGPGPGPDIPPPCDDGDDTCDDLWRWTYDSNIVGTCLHFADVCF